MPRFALVSDHRSADHDDDLAPLLAALGSEAELALWDDPEVDWSVYDLAVIRSTWDYVDQPDEFCSWAAATAVRATTPMTWTVHGTTAPEEFTGSRAAWATVARASVRTAPG